MQTEGKLRSYNLSNIYFMKSTLFQLVTKITLTNQVFCIDYEAFIIFFVGNLTLNIFLTNLNDEIDIIKQHY